MPRKDVPPSQIKDILDLMSKYGIIRVTFDPATSGSEVEYWQLTGPGLDGRIKDDILLTREEKEYYASEYDKYSSPNE
jgi:hypothetical protein